MPLDPQVAAYYANLPPAPPIYTLPIEAARRRLDKVYNDRAQSPAVHAVADMDIPCSWGELPIRIYTPGDGEHYPVLLFFHGGGFCLHNIASHDSLCRALSNACGCVVASVGYRLAPEHPFPACMQDGFAALQWIYDNAALLHADRSRIALAGDSAGACICAVLSLLARDHGPKVSLQVLCYGPAGCIPEDESASVAAYGGGEYVLPRPMTDWLNQLYRPKGVDLNNPYLNPGRAPDLEGLPKTLSITAEFDPLRDDGEAFAAALQAAGNDVTLVRAEGMMHGFLLLWDKFDAAQAIIQYIGKTVRETFAK